MPSFYSWLWDRRKIGYESEKGSQAIYEDILAYEEMWEECGLHDRKRCKELFEECQRVAQVRLREYNESMQKKRRRKKKKKLRPKKGSLKRTTKSKVKASRCGARYDQDGDFTWGNLSSHDIEQLGPPRRTRSAAKESPAGEGDTNDIMHNDLRAVSPLHTISLRVDTRHSLDEPGTSTSGGLHGHMPGMMTEDSSSVSLSLTDR